MFRLASQAYARLSPEGQLVAEIFLRALPPFARRQIRSVRLYGVQARRFEPDAPFDLLVVADTRSIEVKTSLAIATSAVEGEAAQVVRVTLLTGFEVAQPTVQLSRVLQNAQREGVELWVRAAVTG